MTGNIIQKKQKARIIFKKVKIVLLQKIQINTNDLL
jgi:hypothetical protein